MLQFPWRLFRKPKIKTMDPESTVGMKDPCRSTTLVCFMGNIDPRIYYLSRHATSLQILKQWNTPELACLHFLDQRWLYKTALCMLRTSRLRSASMTSNFADESAEHSTDRILPGVVLGRVKPGRPQGVLVHAEAIVEHA